MVRLNVLEMYLGIAAVQLEVCLCCGEVWSR